VNAFAKINLCLDVLRRKENGYHEVEMVMTNVDIFDVLEIKELEEKELIKKIKEEVPDIVITDIKMPLVSGMEVAKYVYENQFSTKVIILTAYADFEYAKEAIEYDVCGYVVKTSAIEELPTILRKAITQLSSHNEPDEEEAFPEDIFGKLQKFIEDNKPHFYKLKENNKS